MPDRPKRNDPLRRLHDFREANVAFQMMTSPYYGQHLGGLMKGDTDPDRKISREHIEPTWDQATNQILDSLQPILAMASLPLPDRPQPIDVEPPGFDIEEVQAPRATVLEDLGEPEVPVDPPFESLVDDQFNPLDVLPPLIFEPFDDDRQVALEDLDFLIEPQPQLFEQADAYSEIDTPSPSIAFENATQEIPQPPSPPERQSNIPFVRGTDSVEPIRPTSRAPWLPPPQPKIVSPEDPLGALPPPSPPSWEATSMYGIDHSSLTPIIIRDPGGTLIDRPRSAAETQHVEDYVEYDAVVDGYNRRLLDTLEAQTLMLFRLKERLDLLHAALASETVDEKY